MNSQFIKHHPISSALLSAVVALPLVFAMYFTFEPMVVLGQDSRDFTVSQEIDEEIAFVADPNDVVMDTTLGGLTGGTANGTTTFSVATNSPSGYTITISFDTNGSDQAMTYNPDPENFFITNLSGSAVDDLTEPSANQAALFAYSIVGNNVTSTLADDGSVCDSGTTGTGGACFFMQGTASSPETIIDSSDPTSGSGNENSVVFRTVVGQDPDPALPTGSYTATATLTAAVQ